MFYPARDFCSWAMWDGVRVVWDSISWSCSKCRTTSLAYFSSVLGPPGVLQREEQHFSLSLPGLSYVNVKIKTINCIRLGYLIYTPQGRCRRIVGETKWPEWWEPRVASTFGDSDHTWQGWDRLGLEHRTPSALLSHDRPQTSQTFTPPAARQVISWRRRNK